MQVSIEMINQFPVAKKVAIIRHQLNQMFMERQEVIDALIALYISKQHGLLLGPPGTGKSLLLDWVCYALGGDFFSALMNEYTKMEELLGAVSIKKLQEEDILERNTQGMLPTATIAYLDEMFKSNSAILNTLLQMINERIFKNPHAGKIPLRSLFASSNELLDDIGAFLDRFVYKTMIPYMGKDSRTVFWKRSSEDKKNKIKRTKENYLIQLQAGDVERIEDLVAAIDVPLALIDAIYTELQSSLKVEISDRKWLWIFDFLKAVEWVRNPKATTVSAETVGLYLADCLWLNPEMGSKIQAQVNQVVANWKTPESEAQEQVDEATEYIQGLLETWGNKVDGDHEAIASCITVARTAIVKAQQKVTELLGADDDPFQDILEAKLDRVNELEAFNKERVFDFHFKERGAVIAGVRHRLSNLTIPDQFSSDHQIEAYFSSVEAILQVIRGEQEKIPTLPLRESDQEELLRLLEEVERHIPDPEDLFADADEIVEVA